MPPTVRIRFKEILSAAGLGKAPQTVFPTATWNQDALEIPHARHIDIDLKGNGVVLPPTAFRIGSTLLSSEMPGEPLKVIYPAHIPMPLLGRTRTAVLKTIATNPSSTTSQIATMLGISPGRVSEHAGVLRDAGLITSHRNTVRHLPIQLGLEIG